MSNKQSSILMNLKARIYAKRFNIWTEEIDELNKEGYFIYNGVIYFGNRLGVFFVSHQKTMGTNEQQETK
jgi:hypothetical protein